MPSINSVVTRGYGVAVTDLPTRGYGTTGAVVLVKKGGAGGGKRKKYRWITVAGSHYRVSSAREEQELVQAWYESKRAELLSAEAATETKKAHYARVSLAKAVKRLENTNMAVALEKEFKRIDRIKEDDEIIVMFLANL